MQELHQWQRTVSLKNAQNLATGYKLDLADAVRVTEDDTDLRRGKTLLGELADHVRHLRGRRLQPRGGSALEGLGRARDTLARSMHATHV